MSTKKERLIAKLQKLAKCVDTESAHVDADDAIINYIDDKDIAEAYSAVPKWYA